MKYLLLLCCLLLSCGKDVAGGGGADVGNPSIAGVVLSGDFNAASGVSLSLQPSDYIGDSSAVQRAVSAPDGSYSFAVEAGQRYTLWGRDSATGAVLFRRALSLADTATTLYDQLEAPCTLTVSLPAGAPLHAGAVALPGVPRAFAAVVDSQARTVRVAGLPRGEIAPLFRQEGAGFVPFTDSLIIGGTTQSAVAYELWEPLLAGGVPLRGDTVRALLASATGARWIGTQRGLLNRAGEHYSSAAVLSLAEDSAGVLWCGTAAGVARLTESGLVAAVESAAPTRAVSALSADDSLLWCGTDSGLFRFNNEQWQHLTTDNSGLSHNNISALLQRNDTLFIGTLGGGVTTFDGAQWDTLTSGNSGLMSDSITALAAHPDSGFFMGTAAGVTRWCPDDLWENLTPANSILPATPIAALALEANGALWVGTSAGTVRYHHRSMMLLTPENSRFTTTHCLSIAVEASAVVSFGTVDGGVVKR